MNEYNRHKKTLERELNMRDGYSEPEVFELIAQGNKTAEQLIVFRRMNLVASTASDFIQARETNHNINIQTLISVGYEKLIEQMPKWIELGSTHTAKYLRRGLRKAFKRHVRYIKDHTIKEGRVQTLNWLDELTYDNDGEPDGHNSDNYADGEQI